jgi:transcriptional regulator with XRE-family HTH domain
VKIQKRFGQIVHERRKAAGISQEALADKAGLHRTYISLLERGLRMPSLGVLHCLAKALKTTMVELVAELERAG